MDGVGRAAVKVQHLPLAHPLEHLAQLGELLWKKVLEPLSETLLKKMSDWELALTFYRPAHFLSTLHFLIEEANVISHVVLLQPCLPTVMGFPLD